MIAEVLAPYLAPHVARLLREQAAPDEALVELLAGSGFEIDTEPAAPRKGRAA